MTQVDKELAATISRIDREIERNAKAQQELWARAGLGEYGEPKLSSTQKKKLAKLVAERRALEESASVAYRI